MSNQPNMEIKELPLTSLQPAGYNPRKKLKKGDKEYEKIKQSLLKFGYVDPIIVNKDLTVIGGHQRLTVLKDLKYETAKCVIVDLPKEDEKALNIALNKITGQWDDQLLADLLLDLQESDFNLDLTGFEAPEIDDILSNIHDKDLKEDDFDVEEELKKPTVAKLGDVWHLGKHRVICGDSTKAETYSALLGDKKANLVVTDPPYNVDVEETAGKILNDNMSDSDFYQFLLAMFTQVEQHMESDASIYVFHADTEGLNFRKAFKDAGFYLSGCCVWKKNSLVLGRSPYQWQHEPCLFGWKQKGKHQWFSDRKQTTIWEYDRPKSSKDHPTMKPIQLMAYPIQNSSMRGTLVLDPFLGSGSTLLASDQTGRVCYGIELDEKFVDVIVRRYMEATGDTAITVNRDDAILTYEQAVQSMQRMSKSFLNNSEN
ncbi:site-specific DNA-methyltransferase [Streptococcus pluranimalium]|uniref:Methyltransferase n=1 Tax=Streptococcus pluranimalium TaxID=82348 RepID=A0A2L0D4I5_9STRE|nr:site-specific DNA-methyltransferase [Streptococcus pluranimalium]AUW96752.1 DNA modification methylase [Streptococcus pluranimalium]